MRIRHFASPLRRFFYVHAEKMYSCPIFELMFVNVAPCAGDRGRGSVHRSGGFGIGRRSSPSLEGRQQLLPPQPYLRIFGGKCNDSCLMFCITHASVSTSAKNTVKAICLMK